MKMTTKFLYKSFECVYEIEMTSETHTHITKHTSHVKYETMYLLLYTAIWIVFFLNDKMILQLQGVY